MKHICTRLAAAAAALALPVVGSAQPNLDSRAFDVRPDAVVQLRDIPGPVYVTASGANSVFVRIVRAAGADAAQAELRVEHSRDRFVLYGDRAMDPEAVRIQIHLVVPSSVRLDARNVRGEMRVDGRTGGGVSAADVAGRVHLEEVDGPVTAHRIGGAFVARLRGVEPVRIEQVSGSVHLQVDSVREVLVSPGNSSVRIRAPIPPDVDRRESTQVFTFAGDGRHIEIRGITGAIEITVK